MHRPLLARAGVFSMWLLGVSAAPAGDSGAPCPCIFIPPEEQVRELETSATAVKPATYPFGDAEDTESDEKAAPDFGHFNDASGSTG